MGSSSRLGSSAPIATRAVWILLWVLFAILPFGCARVGRYHSPSPVPGAPQPSGHLDTESSDSTVVLVYGDNRPGYMVLSRSIGAPVVRNAMRSRSPGQWLIGLIHVPIAALQLVLPTFDGVRDIWARYSKRYTGGNELGVLRSLAAERNIDLVVNTGDLVEDGRYGGQWNDFVRRHSALRESVPFVAAPGNHERTWNEFGDDNWDSIVGSPAGPGRHWLVADVGPARFVLLDSNPIVNVGHRYPTDVEMELSEAQLTWADSVLAKPFPFKFVVLHHPLVTAGHHIDDWTDDDGRNPSRRERMLDMFYRHGVTAVFAGHEHLYERTWIGNADGTKGFWHITTGGGGSPLYRIPGERRRLALAQKLPGGSRIFFPSEQQSVYHFCRLVLRESGPADSGSSAALRVYRVDRNRATGVIDTIDLTRSSAMR